MRRSKFTAWLSGLALVHIGNADKSYKSRPDLAPPHLNITIPATSEVEQGDLFIAPYSWSENGTPQSGPYILDSSGELVWSGYGYFNPTTVNFQPSRWKGQAVLFGYEGTLNRLRGHGHGHHKILDQNYQTIREVRHGNHYLSDLHEFNIVDETTALTGSYTPHEVDLTPYGGDENQTWVLNFILQELDIETGEVLFEWHSLDHTSPEESVLPLGPRAGLGYNSSTAWDYIHVNSITKGVDGHYLLSARSASTLYKINGTDGSVIWRVGGKFSDFKLGPGVEFAFQHHARYVSGALDTISFFDNSAGGGSAGKIVSFDFDKGEAMLRQAFHPPHSIVAFSQGSTQVLPNGNVLVNWGSEDQITEFNGEGDVLFHAYLESGARQLNTQNYRAFKGNWTGFSPETPALTVEDDGEGKITVWVSWNGDTRTTSWRALLNSSSDGLSSGGLSRLSTYIFAKNGFETKFDISNRSSAGALQVEALDAHGKVLSRSEITAVSRSKPGEPSQGPKEYKKFSEGSSEQRVLGGF